MPGDPHHWLLLTLGLGIGVMLLLLVWWFVIRMELRISTLVSREVQGIITQINAFREDAIAEARLAVSSARTSHALLLKVESKVADLDRRLLALEYPDAGPRSGGGPSR